MKYVILISILLSHNLISFSDNPVKIMYFINRTHDFGKVCADKQPLITENFIYINKSDKPMVILKTKVACGCTSVEWDKRPVMPGKKGIIKVIFHSTKVKGRFNKSIYVQSNLDKDILRISGTVTN